MNVGVMKDYKLKLRNLHSSNTLGFRELEHLKTKTRFIDDMFASVMGEYVFLKS